MGEEEKRTAEYFVVAGLPKENPQPLGDSNLEVNLKDSYYLDPITDITVIFPRLGETVPDHYVMVETTPEGHSANLNHGSFRANDVFLCYRRGRHVQPLVEIGVFYNGKDVPLPETQILECSPQHHRANVNNTTNSETFLTYRRANENSPSNELVVMDICVILASKGEVPPHSFMKIDKTLNKGIMSSDVFICYKKSVNRCDIISYKPRVLAQYPNKSQEDGFKVDDHVALFCLPMGANLECWPSDRGLPSVMTSKFVLSPTNSEKIYGSAITYYERLVNEEHLTEDQREGLSLRKYRNPKTRNIFMNKCICILSHWPFFEAFEKFLFFLYQSIAEENEVPLERYIHQFLFEIPFPSPTRPRILYQLDSESRIPFFQPEELPLPRSGASFGNLLMSLGPDNCLLVLLLALTEQKILLHSFRPDVLTSVAEALKQIIFPFYWQCPYIPLCPIGMSDYLAAPLPFVIGLDSRFFDMYDQPSDVNAIDLDTKTITLSSAALNASLLPKRAARTLRTSLGALLDKCYENEANAIKLEAQNDRELDFEFIMKRREILLELEIRETFLRFMVSILSGYRNFLLPLTKAPTVGATDVSNLFDSTAFIHSRDRYHHKFYHLLMKTQMFTKFIEERSFVSDVNAYLAFFDECMDKSDRGGDSRFLELDDVESARTVYILPPDASDLQPGTKYVYEKMEYLNPDLFAGPSKQIIDIPSEVHNFSEPSDALSTPLAKRTKQEIRSAQKYAKTVHPKPYLWPKCLVNTSYSLWFIHLPSYVMHEGNRKTSLRAGFSILRRMRKLRLHPADEICYRVMMQLCGRYQNPSLAVSILMEMKDCSHYPNAVTYGYYNKAVLECNWSSGPATKGQINWNKLRNAIRAIKHFREAQISRQQQQVANATASTTTPNPKQPEGDNVSRASSEESGVSQEFTSNEAKEELQGGHPLHYDVGYSSMNENGIQLEGGGVVCETLPLEPSRQESELHSEDSSNTTSRPKKGVQRALFERSDSEDLAAGVRDYYEGSYSPPPHSSSKSRSQSVDSELIGIPITPNSSSLDPVAERLSVGGYSFKSPMIGTPVTSNDPLGALLPKTNLEHKMDGGVKVSNSYSTLHSRLEDNVLGEPFSNSKALGADGSSLARSSTLPRSLYEEAGKFSTSPFSLKSFSKSSVTNRLKQGSTYLLNSLSPNTKTTQDVLTNIRSNVSSAATHLKTKYLDTATSLNDEHSDKISLGSNDSRRASEVAGGTSLTGMSNGDTELWSALTGSFWDKWMGNSSPALPPPDMPKLSTTCDNFDKHYSSIPRYLIHPVALSIDITSVTRCLVCDSAMYDEEIMAGWTAEDSNLNTKCAFCSKLFVPSLSITVKDFRSCPSALRFTNLGSIQVSRRREPKRTHRKSERKTHRSVSCDRSESLPPPEIFDTIRVPYLSPLVLRKELECILDREGDQCLNDPSVVDDHPIIYWNLVWYFNRIGVKSHIPGFCLKAKSLYRSESFIHPSWDDANVHNVCINCLWDNPEIHSKYLPYLYLQYLTPEAGTSPLVQALLHPFNPLSSRGRINKIIEGVRSDKLDEPMRLFFEERKHSQSRKRLGLSMYRDILFLTCVVNGCDNVNFVAFDRIYRNTLNALRPTYQKYIFKSDEVPEEKAVICRRFFKSLVL